MVARMKAQAEADRAALREIAEAGAAAGQEIVDEQVKRLERGAARSVDAGLRTIERDIEARVERSVQGVQAAIWRIWLRPLLTGGLISLGLFAGTLGWSRWLTADIGSKLDEQARLTLRIGEQRQTLERIEAATWGMEYIEDDGGRFLVAPPGVTFDNNWTFGRGTARERRGVRLVEGS